MTAEPKKGRVQDGALTAIAAAVLAVPGPASAPAPCVVTSGFSSGMIEKSVAAEAAGARPPQPPLKGDGMDIWRQSVEARLGSLNDKMDRNLLWTMGGFGAVVLAGLTMFTATSSKLDQSFDKLSAKIDGVSAQVSEVGERVARLEGAAEKQK